MAIVRRTLFSDGFTEANIDLGPPTYTTDGAAYPIRVEYIGALNDNVATATGGNPSGVRTERSALLLGDHQWVEGTISRDNMPSDFFALLVTGFNTVGTGYYLGVSNSIVYVGSGSGVYDQYNYTVKPDDVFRLECYFRSINHSAQTADVDLVGYINDVEVINTNNNGEYIYGDSAGITIVPSGSTAKDFGWLNFSAGDWIEEGVTPVIDNVNGASNTAITKGPFVINGSSLSSIAGVSVRTRLGNHDYPLTISSQSSTVIQCTVWDIHNTRIPYGSTLVVLTHSGGEIQHRFELEPISSQIVTTGAALDYTYGLAQSNPGDALSGDIWEMPQSPGGGGTQATLYPDTNILFVPGPTDTRVWDYYQYVNKTARWEMGTATLKGITVPDYEEVDKPVLPSIWAVGGTKISPPDGKKDTGWVSELPGAEYENYLENRQDTYLHHLNERGFPEWDKYTDYFKNAYCYYVDDVYVALRDNTDTEPGDNPSDWEKWHHQFEPAGLIKMWYGINKIPVGWVLCDGTRGTLDLRDRFIKSANSTGSNAGVLAGGTAGTVSSSVPGHDHGGVTSESGVVSAGVTGTSSTHTHPISDDEDHSHTGLSSSSTISTDQMPIHRHGFRKTQTPGAGGSGSGSVYTQARASGFTGEGEAHNHPVVIYNDGDHDHGGTAPSANAHYHTTPAAPAHSHTINTQGGHTHNVQDPVPEYVTVVFIQKV